MRDRGGNGSRRHGMDMSLKREALDEESQQREQRYHSLRGGGFLNQTARTARHTLPGKIRPQTMQISVLHRNCAILQRPRRKGADGAARMMGKGLQHLNPCGQGRTRDAAFEPAQGAGNAAIR